MINYGDDNDVDIIEIPIELSKDIMRLAYSYDTWVLYEAPRDDSDFWVNKNGKEIPNLETAGFIKWLNKYHCKKNRKAVIIKQHTAFVSGIRCIEW